MGICPLLWPGPPPYTSPGLPVWPPRGLKPHSACREDAGHPGEQLAHLHHHPPAAGLPGPRTQPPPPGGQLPGGRRGESVLLTGLLQLLQLWRQPPPPALPCGQGAAARRPVQTLAEEAFAPVRRRRHGVLQEGLLHQVQGHPVAGLDHRPRGLPHELLHGPVSAASVRVPRHRVLLPRHGVQPAEDQRHQHGRDVLLRADRAQAALHDVLQLAAQHREDGRPRHDRGFLRMHID